ncbi:hypothetical protein HRR83_006775 [Exophiala dermatitidis]|uniref:5'/3'-nucleotidase SurE n=2 Tax=Exophiala dermatitidis TaxID=5970 RepID=H6BV58_EXODN|nr:5'/3'-nucleotidase SurE [Exophiala dermatitidis NIH/UT8656]KAJ4511508.1 hypothetical protein HRR75_005435 [Exophiala dermatitidis]EHY55841.1 5'/3'-nucleotidase SurE [Exophiala dermatitidis NIH/UT8656]KAJ4514276.1 hypothetical protein HRR74_005936 [Exophiala dermatitidis]KAJ4515240.1 hypothetical protein HRR73_005070 [Exophiala dermatitidis]KAJ4535356.1 hypothetical protein HRR77_007974 [Exophiala dermatitidis]
MRFSILSATLAASCFFASSSAISILLGNDDGFAAAQVREFYRLLKADGHDVVLVAPADNESGQGGRAVFTTSKNLTVPSEFNIIPAGAPSLGRDPTDPDVWYYNGTPAACTYVALDYVIPNFYDNRTIDLYLGGPNFGLNPGPFYYTLSGTIGGTYAAIQRNIPAIAFSGANSEQRSYTWINKTTASGHPDPATIHAQLALDVVTALVKGSKPGERLLPLGYGINVNAPFITSLTNDTCVSPSFYQTRITGGAMTDRAIYNKTTGLFTYGNAMTEGLNTCINGDCSLPGETDVVDDGCSVAVSVFSIDYTAPLGAANTGIRDALSPLVQFPNKNGKMMIKARDTLTREEKEARHPLRQA